MPKPLARKDLAISDGAGALAGQWQRAPRLKGRCEDGAGGARYQASSRRPSRAPAMVTTPIPIGYQTATKNGESSAQWRP